MTARLDASARNSWTLAVARRAHCVAGADERAFSCFSIPLSPWSLLSRIFHPEQRHSLTAAITGAVSIAGVHLFFRSLAPIRRYQVKLESKSESEYNCLIAG